MSEWFYIGLAYTVTYVVLTGYGIYLRGRYKAARIAAERSTKGGTS